MKPKNLWRVIVSRIDEKVDGGEARRHEWPPPPVVVLSGKVEVAQQNRRLRARDDQDDGDFNEC